MDDLPAVHPGEGPGRRSAPPPRIPDGVVVGFGEVMLRLSPPAHARIGETNVFEATFGGAEANVITALARLDVPARIVTRLPSNELGDAVVRWLRGNGVDARHVLRGGERLGIYFVETGAAQRGSRVLYDRAGSSMATLEPGTVDWHAALEGATWLHVTGITPGLSRSACEATREALDAARAAGLTISIDLNHRKALWRWGTSPATVMSELVLRAHVLIGNAGDARQMLGVAPLPGDADPERTTCERLHERFPGLRFVALTQRHGVSASHDTWAGFVSDGTQSLASRTYEVVPIVDRVGTGDAFAAGIIDGLRCGADLARTVEFAAAAGCLKHSLRGDVMALTRDEIEAFLAGDRTGRIQR